MYVLYVPTRVPEYVRMYCMYQQGYLNTYVLYVLTRVPEYVCTVCTNKGT